jgi:hypothetical protein
LTFLSLQVQLIAVSVVVVEADREAQLVVVAEEQPVVVVVIAELVTRVCRCRAVRVRTVRNAVMIMEPSLAQPRDRSVENAVGETISAECVRLVVYTQSTNQIAMVMSIGWSLPQ